MARLIRILILVFCFYNLIFIGRVFPFTSVAGVDISGVTPENAANILSKKIKAPEKIILKSGGVPFEISSSDMELSYDFEASTKRAYEMTRTGNVLFDLAKRTKLIFSSQNQGLTVDLNEEALQKQLSTVAEQIAVEPVFPSAKKSGGEVVVDKGRAGTEMDIKTLRALIGHSLAFAKSDTIEIPVQKIDPTLTDEQAQNFKQRAEKYLSKSIAATFEFESFKLTDVDMLNLLDPKGDFSEEGLNSEIFGIASKINRGPQNPKFEFASGKVSEFLPAKDGVELNSDQFKETIIQNLNSLADSEEKFLSFEVPVKRTPPATSTETVNDLGIKELIGRGTSKFKGSIASRVHNIELASSRLNGILIKPGETFSFNNALGDVSKFTGYQEAYVIREGKTILGDGGGVCQVSTTFFRAALNAGLSIFERQAHAYRVGYYEQDSPPGLDATVYGPSPDLKIKNDTPAHILIQAKVDKKNSSLVFELYGTSDGRVATISKPITKDVVQPGEDLYIDDPTLPAGTVKQTEHKANGAKVTFNYLVQRGGETIYKKIFISNYRPWQAVYLRGTAPDQ